MSPLLRKFHTLISCSAGVASESGEQSSNPMLYAELIEIRFVQCTNHSCPVGCGKEVIHIFSTDTCICDPTVKTMSTVRFVSTYGHSPWILRYE